MALTKRRKEASLGKKPVPPVGGVSFLFGWGWLVFKSARE